ncbi:hypothetical protein L2E82_08209 [Cichorium intybus]|uniref:Uncharacterized protein n=1 Tax=Cichorium intybus TaxID=13427 RepID=A0ACB9G5B3_CICIN|nr:hypothetical protein L2E82_08209 [Cichorium intybus]
MKEGFYDKMEMELQGQQNTYYVDGLVACELIEKNSTYAMNFIRKHFANDDPLPNFPYVKRFFPLLSDSLDRNPEQLDEYPGDHVTFLIVYRGFLQKKEMEVREQLRRVAQVCFHHSKY